MFRFITVKLHLFMMIWTVSSLPTSRIDKSITQQVHSNLLLLDPKFKPMPLNRQGKAINIPSVPSGGALDLFHRFGFFSLSVRVVPRDDPGKWLVREPTSSIFNPSTYTNMETFQSNSFIQDPIEIFLCDDLSELKEAYFRHFDAEGIIQPHKLYTASWRGSTVSKYFGLPQTAFNPSNAYVLLRFNKKTMTTEIKDQPEKRLKSEALAFSANINTNDPQSVLEFVKQYGSHYVQSITVGDSIYQILVINRNQMKELKDIYAGKSPLNLNDWEEIYEKYLVPWKVLETGKVLVASGDEALEGWVDKNLRIETEFGSYPSLINGLLGSERRIAELEELGGKSDNAIVAANFASLRSFIGLNSEFQLRYFFDEIVDTQAQLWQLNL